MSVIRRKRAIEGGRGKRRACRLLCGKMCEGVCGGGVLDRAGKKSKIQAELIIIKCKEYIKV